MSTRRSYVFRNTNPKRDAFYTEEYRNHTYRAPWLEGDYIKVPKIVPTLTIPLMIWLMH